MASEIIIDLTKQTLMLLNADVVDAQYSISSAINGPGEKQGSACTPTGKHIIRAKIGDHCPIGSVFVGRRPTGEIYSADLSQQFPERDWILTRILWLSGLELGKNRLANVDSMRRFIYIHGTPDTEPMGIARSHGCIRMRNIDVLNLFNKVQVGTSVVIHD